MIFSELNYSCLSTPPLKRLVLHNNQLSANLLVEYHANGGGGSWHANRCTSGQLSFEGSWILHFDAQSVKMQPAARAFPLFLFYEMTAGYGAHCPIV